MRRVLALWLAALLCTGTGLPVAAQDAKPRPQDGSATGAGGGRIILDRPVKAAGLMLFPVVGEPKSYLYAPMTPRLAQDAAGRPQFSFLRYVQNVSGSGGQDAPDEGEGGGILHAVVTLDVPKSQLERAQQELEAADSGAKIIGPAIYQSGQFALVSAVVAGGGDPQKKDVPRLAYEIVGLGTAPVLEGGKAAVSILLTKLGAKVLWQSFQMPTPDISFKFEMKLPGFWSPAKARIVADLDQVYQNEKIQAAGATPMFEFEIKKAVEEMMEKRAIRVEIIGGGGDAQFNKYVDAAHDAIKKLIFEDAKSVPGTPPAGDSKPGAAGKSLLDRAQAIQKENRDARKANKKSEVDAVEADRLWKLYLEADAKATQLEQEYRDARDAKTERDQEVVASREAGPTDDSGKADQKPPVEPEKPGAPKETPKPENATGDGPKPDPKPDAKPEQTPKPEPTQKPEVAVKPDAKLAEAEAAKKAEDEKKRKEAEAKRAEEATKKADAAKLTDEAAKLAKAKQEEEAKAAKAKQEEAAKLAKAKQDAEAAEAKKLKDSETKQEKAAQTAVDSKKEDAQKARKTADDLKTRAETARTAANTSSAQASEEGDQLEFVGYASYELKQTRRTGRFEYSLDKYSNGELGVRFDENIGDLSQYLDDANYFREVNLDDPLYKQREIAVYVDGPNSEDFGKFINFVTVQLRKRHQNGEMTTDEVRIDRNNFNKEGNRFRMLYGWKGDDDREAWMQYEWRAIWSFFGGKDVEEPWQSTVASGVRASPPYKIRSVSLEADPEEVKAAGVRAITVRLYYDLEGMEQTEQITLNASRGELSTRVPFMLPAGKYDYGYEISWRLRGNRVVDQPRARSSEAILFVDELPAETASE